MALVGVVSVYAVVVVQRVVGDGSDQSSQAHLNDTPQPLRVGVARQDEQASAAREKHGQAKQRHFKLRLVDTELRTVV